MFRRAGATLFVLAMLTQSAPAAEARIAVAANFTEAVKEIGTLFEQKTPHRTVFSFASTGTLYTQIINGAPFDVFLAADRNRPRKAIDEGFAVNDTAFTYALGKIVLYSRDPALVDGRETLIHAHFEKIALANPVTAPYGAAAVQAMTALGVLEKLTPKFVQGNNIAQTYQFIDTGNAALGFAALSQIAGHGKGSRWAVPEDLYDPIRQDAVLLKHGETNHAARAFLEFLRSPDADAVKRKFGYGSGA